MNGGSARLVAYAAVLGGVLVISGREGHARTVAATAQLDYSAAAGCPAAGEFQAIVDGRLGYAAFRADAPDRVVVTIVGGGRAMEGRLEWQHVGGGTIGEQTFPSLSGDCAELTRAMAFALAVQLQLMAATADTSPPPPPPSPPPTAPPPVSLATVPVAATDVPDPLAARRDHQPEAGVRSNRRWTMGAGASAGLGVADQPVALGRLFVALGWTHAAIELGGEASLPSTTRRPDGAGFSQFQLLAELAGCGVRGPFSACAVGKAGQLRVSGRDVDVPATATALAAQAGLRLAAAYALGHRLLFVGRAEGLARLTQGTVTLDSMPVWRTPRIATLLGVDVVWRFE